MYYIILFSGKMEILTLNGKGQVTIPAKIRKRRDFQEGSRVGLVEIGERIELIGLPEDPILGLRGLGSRLLSIEDIETEADRE